PASSLPPVLSFLEKKKRKQSLDRRRGKTRIYVGNHINRWLALKEKLDFRNDAEVAGFLLDLNSCHSCSDLLAKTTLVHNGWSTTSEART
uniref:ZN692 protein n=1 Tax=Amazona collaria TaxID=241587 RepID=A0A8B9FLP3_9PSIT